MQDSCYNWHREVQPGVDPDQHCTADSNKKVQTPFIQWKRQEVWISCYFLSVGKTFDSISIWFITTKNRVGSSSRVHFVAWGKNFVKLRREMVLSHVICRYLFAHRGSSRKSAENRQNMTSLVEYKPNKILILGKVGFQSYQATAASWSGNTCQPSIQLIRLSHL